MLLREFGDFGRFWDPWREFDRLLSDYAPTRQREYPPVNYWSGQDEAVVTAEIPGVDPKDIDISVEGDTLTLRGTLTEPELKEGEVFYRRERNYGDFSRTLNLPFAVDAEKVKAKFTNGILAVTLSRAEADKPKKIAVRTE